MNPNEVLRIVDSLHRDKNIDKELVFVAIESALVSAARKHFGEEADVSFQIDRTSGAISGQVNGEQLDYEEMVGRIGAQTAKQVIIQKVREAERDARQLEFEQQIGELVNGTVNRNEGSVTTVNLGAVEAILPRSEQISGESHQPNERIRAVITEVKPQGSRVKVVLSRTRPALVQRLFELEIPEVSEGVITINAIAREPGQRSKVAVSSIDSKVDCVGACVGVRGNRIRGIMDELAGERIDIVPWHADPQVFIRNALKPAAIDEVILCQMIGRAIVLVPEDQLPIAIGKRGMNVWLASKLCGWDIEIMTQEQLEKQIEQAVQGFLTIDGMTEDLANQLVGVGYLSYDDLSVIEPDDLMEMGNLTAEQVDHIVLQAEEKAEQAERIAAEERRRLKAEAAAAEAAAQAAATVAGAAASATTPSAPGDETAAPGDETRATDEARAVEPSHEGDATPSTNGETTPTSEMETAPAERAAGGAEPEGG
jgi:N utilization substance protein A